MQENNEVFTVEMGSETMLESDRLGNEFGSVVALVVRPPFQPGPAFEETVLPDGRGRIKEVFSTQRETVLRVEVRGGSDEERDQERRSLALNAIGERVRLMLNSPEEVLVAEHRTTEGPPLQKLH